MSDTQPRAPHLPGNPSPRDLHVQLRGLHRAIERAINFATVGNVAAALATAQAALAAHAALVAGHPAHALGGAMHVASLLAELNALIADADLDAAGTPRPPIAHAPTHVNPLLDPIQYATAAQRGLMSNIAQTFGGVKTFNARVNSPSHSILTRRIECEVFTAAGINACMAELGASGGEVYLPENTYLITESIVIPQDNITLCGAGKGTILNASAGQAFHIIDLGTHHRCVIKDLQIIGNIGEIGTWYGITMSNATYLTVEGCYISDTDNVGILLHGTNLIVTKNILDQCGGIGIYALTGSQIEISENVIRLCASGIVSGGGMTFCTIANNKIYDPVTHGVQVTNGWANIHDNTIYTAGTSGIDIASASPSCQVIDNTIYNGNNNGSDIRVRGASHYAIIIGNQCYSTAIHSERAIWLENGDYAIVQGNVSIGHDTCGIQIDAASTNASIGGNILLDTVKVIDNGSDHTFAVHASLTLPETVTPTALASHAKLYAKNDDKAYWQDGAGAEHELAYVATQFEVEADGDTYYVGTAGMPYGEIWVRNNAVETAIGVANVFVQFTGFTINGSSNNTTLDHTNDHIEIDIAGDYLCVCSFTVESIAAGAADHISIEVRKNNGVTSYGNLCVCRKLAGGGGDVGSLSISGILPNLALNDTIEIWLTNEDNATNILVDNANLTITQIGGAG